MCCPFHCSYLTGYQFARCEGHNSYRKGMKHIILKVYCILCHYMLQLSCSSRLCFNLELSVVTLMSVRFKCSISNKIAIRRLLMPKFISVILPLTYTQKIFNYSQRVKFGHYLLGLIRIHKHLRFDFRFHYLKGITRSYNAPSLFPIPQKIVIVWHSIVHCQACRNKPSQPPPHGENKPIHYMGVLQVALLASLDLGTATSNQFCICIMK